MSRPFVVAGVRATHRRASVDQLESASNPDPRTRIEELLDRDAVGEALVLQTCNRVEEYVVAETADRGREALADFSRRVPDSAVVRTGHEESLRHLLRVAAGLESQVLGEDQILGQVREAYLAAKDADALGPVLEDGLLKAIHVGERARAETAVNEGTVSIGSAAVDLAARERGLDGSVTVIGAGETARTVVAALADRDAGDLTIVNRSPERARSLAAECDCPAESAGLADLPSALAGATVAFTATGSDEPVVDAAAVSDAGELFVADLARPRDVAPEAAAVDGVTVRDLDALRDVTAATHERRREAAVEVETIVDEEFERLLDQYKRQRADAVIAAMYKGAERVKQRELAEARTKLDGADSRAEQREVLNGLADAIVSQLMAVPTESLRDAAAEDDWETIETAIELFDPGLGEAGPDLFEAMAHQSQSPDAATENRTADAVDED